VARYQEPNPLDLYFFAADQAMRRIGQPGANIHLCLELRGHVDVEGFRLAVEAVRRVYPASGARLERSAITGRPRWRLESALSDVETVVEVRELSDDTEECAHCQIERLLNEPIDLHASPVRFVVLRGLSSGDRVIARWSHALMDGRGGVTLLEEIDRLYRQGPPPSECVSVGDELRDDFSNLLAGAPPMMPLRRGNNVGGIRPARWRTIRLTDEVHPSALGPVRYLVRRLTPEQTRTAKEVSLRVCGIARFGDFMRACAIRALDRLIPRPLPAHAGYCTLNLIDHRKRRQSAPVCRNLTNALPMYVPAEAAGDRKAVADLARDQMAALLACGAMSQRLLAARRIARIPTGLLVSILHRGIVAARMNSLPAGMGNAPSLPLGLIGSFSRRMPSFCGAELTNIYGLRPAPFQTGISVDVNEAQERLNVAGMYFETAVSTQRMTAFLDDFTNSLLSVE
jgi:hypothetical protein